MTIRQKVGKSKTNLSISEKVAKVKLENRKLNESDKDMNYEDSIAKKIDKTSTKKAKSDSKTNVYPDYPRAKNNSGVGKMAKECIKKGFNFQKTLEFIKSKVKDTHFSKKCYYWYRHHLVLDKEVKSLPVIVH